MGNSGVNTAYRDHFFANWLEDRFRDPPATERLFTLTELEEAFNLAWRAADTVAFGEQIQSLLELRPMNSSGKMVVINRGNETIVAQVYSEGDRVLGAVFCAAIPFKDDGPDYDAIEDEIDRWNIKLVKRQNASGNS